MRTLYWDCAMGAAGDMLCASLLALLPDPDGAVAELNGLGLPGVEMALVPAEKCGITGWQFRVKVHGAEEEEHLHDGHHHTTVADIRRLVAGCEGLSPAVKQDVLAVYDAIAAAESKVHGVTVEQVHFHEVGTLDALADVTACCWLIHRLAPERIMASPVHVGSGTVRCAHGILPVPAPATAELLRGVPICGGDIDGELCTPTGAALLAHFAGEFGPMPVLRVENIGYGMGKKDFPRANCVRALLGQTEGETDTVTALECNVDDMTAEDVGFAMERLYDAGALEVFTAAVGMKKNRPGILLRVLCRPEDADAVAGALFRHTATIGVREQSLRRRVLTRQTVTVETPFGPVRQKVSVGCGAEKRKWEYDDLAAIARREGLSLQEVRDALNTYLRDGQTR